MQKLIKQLKNSHHYVTHYCIYIQSRIDLKQNSC
uniref:Uncharacterized protein n=1 Tax=Cannabis sativa TaxID=3483 RepID=A0A803RBP5_CANSA